MKFSKLLASGFFFALALAAPVWNFASNPRALALPDESTFAEMSVDENSAGAPADSPPTLPEESRIPIFVYHGVRETGIFESPIVKRYNVSPATLERELAFLKYNGYTALSFQDLSNFLNRGASIPEKSVILSFDDGWQDQYTDAFPLLQKYGFTATFFIFTNSIGKPHFLTEAQIIAMSEAGMEIGAHTMSHPYLTRITEAEAELEILGSKTKLEEITGKEVKFFAYPFGQSNASLEKFVRDAGFIAARGTVRGAKNSLSDLFRLKSIEATNDFGDFERNLSK